MSRSTRRPRASTADESGNPAPSNSSGSALQGFRTGDPAAVAEVESRVRRIISYRGYGIPGPEQEELRQEVLVQVWQSVNREGFDAQRGFWGFVQVVTARRCIDWSRKRRERHISHLKLVPDERPGPLRQALASERREAVREAFGQLAAGCRELIEFRVSAEKSYTEIARITGRSEQALRAQMYRCVKKLQTMIRPSRELSHEPQ